MDIKRLFAFLRELETNNNTLWMRAHRQEYNDLREQFFPMVQTITDRIAAYDNSLAGVEAKDCIYRINRNLRFSPDKRPYKNFFSAYMVRGGRHCYRSGYYLHLQPGEAFLASGLYSPTPEMLRAIRSEIDYNGDRLVELLGDKRLKGAFAMDDERLKTTPKGYPADHKHIELLRMKNFGFTRNYSDKVIENMPCEKLVDAIVENFAIVVPVAKFFNEALSDVL